MKRVRRVLLFVLGSIALSSPSWSDGSGGTSAGLVLLRNGGARSSALGDAFVTVPNDITAMEFNPSAVATLESGQASLQHEQGIFDDTFNKAMLGVRTASHGAFGLSVGYYNSGNTSLFDGVSVHQSVAAEQDRVADLAYGFAYNAYRFGVDVKYVSSQLAETNTASAYSGDVGLQREVTPNLRIGVSGPVASSSLRYVSTGEKLPRVYRAGVGWLANLPLATGKLPLQFLMDVPYDANQSAFAIALGAETHIGVMALRIGYNTQSDLQQFSVGTGFQFARMNLDYSFGMAQSGNANALQKITFSFRFDDARTHSLAAPAVLSSNAPAETQQWALTADSPAPKGPKRAVIPIDNVSYTVYELKPGETLESVAMLRYGSTSFWHEIYAANAHMYASPEDIKAGSTILLPTKKGS